jgi:ribose transport system substrate-binding protein
MRVLPHQVLSNQAEREVRYVIGFSQATTTEPWRLLFNKELRAEAALHPELDVIVRNGMDDIAKQIADVEEFIDRGVDVILISPKVADALTSVVNKAFNAGIPIIVMDRDLAKDHYTQFIGGDNRLIGQTAGQYAINLLGGPGKAKGKIVEIWGGMCSTPAQDRHLGFYDVISKEPGITLLGEPVDGDWKQDLGYEIMSEALDTYPHIDLVYAHNDPMAYGAYLAAQDVGRAKEMYFLGVDGIPAEGVKWVSKGILTATFRYMTPGAEGIQQALKLLRGEPVNKRIIFPTKTIDATNAAEILRNNHILE